MGLITGKLVGRTTFYGSHTGLYLVLKFTFPRLFGLAYRLLEKTLCGAASSNGRRVTLIKKTKISSLLPLNDVIGDWPHQIHVA